MIQAPVGPSLGKLIAKCPRLSKMSVKNSPAIGTAAAGASASAEGGVSGRKVHCCGACVGIGGDPVALLSRLPDHIERVTREEWHLEQQ